VWRRRSVQSRRGADGASGYFAVVEPGATALRLLVVEAVGGQSAVWGWNRVSGWAGISADVSWLIASCEKALSQAEEMAQELAGRWFLSDQILVGLPASQLRGWAGAVNQRRSRPERPIEEDELEALLARALRLVVNRLQGEGRDDAAWLLVEASLVSLTVDGHGVTDPVGFRGQELGATIFAALTSREAVEAWGAVARELEFSALTLTAAPFALAAHLSERQGVLVDVGSATTDLTWCRAGRPVALDSLPMGGEALTRSLMRKWHLSLDRAENLKRAYSNGRLPDEAKAQVLEVLSPTLRMWLEETEVVLAKLNQNELLPQRLYLLGGGSALPEMAEAVRSLAWSQRLRFVRYPQVGSIRPVDVSGVANRTELGWEPGDVPALALAAWATGQQQPSDRPRRILGELCQEWHSVRVE
jgi:cell division protein FtsA